MTGRALAVRTGVRAVVWTLLGLALVLGGPVLAGLLGATDPALLP